MASVTQALFFLLIFALLFALRESFVHQTRCVYCGGVNRHDAGCPYDI